MSMKKKFLALALAGAVAMPLTANASGTLSHIVTGNDTQDQYGQVTVNGIVQTQTGQAPDGQISVELPTSMGFTVAKDSSVITAGAYTVQNKGKNPVSISVVDFTETQPTTGITVESSDSFSAASKNRAQVALTLTGDNSHVVNLGKFKTDKTEQALLDTVPANGQATVTLNGVAGTNPDSNIDNKGAKEDFVVKFKIHKK